MLIDNYYRLKLYHTRPVKKLHENDIFQYHSESDSNHSAVNCGSDLPSPKPTYTSDSDDSIPPLPPPMPSMNDLLHKGTTYV